MYRRASLIVVLLSSVLVWAADKDFWDTKPYSEWNDKEVEKLLKNSPWSRSVTLSMGTMGAPGYGNESRQQYPRTSGAEPPGTQTGGAESDPVGGGQRGPGGLGDPSERPSIPLVVHWYSRPVREAFARRVLLRKPEAPKEQVDGLLNYDDPTHFAILITGFPGTMPGSAPAELVAETKRRDLSSEEEQSKNSAGGGRTAFRTGATFNPEVSQRSRWKTGPDAGGQRGRTGIETGGRLAAGEVQAGGYGREREARTLREIPATRTRSREESFASSCLRGQNNTWARRFRYSSARSLLSPTSPNTVSIALRAAWS